MAVRQEILTAIDQLPPPEHGSDQFRSELVFDTLQRLSGPDFESATAQNAAEALARKWWKVERRDPGSVWADKSRRRAEAAARTRTKPPNAKDAPLAVGAPSKDDNHPLGSMSVGKDVNASAGAQMSKVVQRSVKFCFVIEDIAANAGADSSSYTFLFEVGVRGVDGDNGAIAALVLDTADSPTPTAQPDTNVESNLSTMVDEVRWHGFTSRGAHVADESDCIIEMTDADMLAWFEGDVNSLDGFLSGRIRVKKGRGFYATWALSSGMVLKAEPMIAAARDFYLAAQAKARL